MQVNDKKKIVVSEGYLSDASSVVEEYLVKNLELFSGVRPFDDVL